MGISGLLPQLRSATTTIRAVDIRGFRVAIDGYGWLHRGVHGCAAELGMGKDTDKYITYCINRINTLVTAGIHVIMVFDGGPLPAKKGTEVDRAASRDAAKETAKRLMKEGNFEGARQSFAKSVDVTPEMAALVINAMRLKWGESRKEVDWLVAPYEADAQLAYLAREGIVDAIMSEDSDNIPYQVPRTIFKWDGTQGDQILLDRVMQLKANDSINLQGFDHEMILYMCILSGCDYLPCVPGVGLKAAHRIVSRHRVPIRILRAMRFQYDVKVPLGYEDGFMSAVYTFKHQSVYDPRSQSLVPLTPIPSALKDDLQQKYENNAQEVPSSEPERTENMKNETGLSFLGSVIPDEVVTGIANGVLDPVTWKPFEFKKQLSLPTTVPSTGQRVTQVGITTFFKKAQSTITKVKILNRMRKIEKKDELVVNESSIAQDDHSKTNNKDLDLQGMNGEKEEQHLNNLNSGNTSTTTAVMRSKHFLGDQISDEPSKKLCRRSSNSELFGSHVTLSKQQTMLPGRGDSRRNKFKVKKFKVPLKMMPTAHMSTDEKENSSDVLLHPSDSVASSEVDCQNKEEEENKEQQEEEEDAPNQRPNDFIEQFSYSRCNLDSSWTVNSSKPVESKFTLKKKIAFKKNDDCAACRGRHRAHTCGSIGVQAQHPIKKKKSQSVIQSGYLNPKGQSSLDRLNASSMKFLDSFAFGASTNQEPSSSAIAATPPITSTISSINSSPQPNCSLIGPEVSPCPSVGYGYGSLSPPVSADHFPSKSNSAIQVATPPEKPVFGVVGKTILFQEFAAT